MARFNFRQGIARRQEDGFGNGANLQPSNGGSWIDLIVSPDPTVFNIAHFDVDYMFTENKTVVKAWGPFTSGVDYWLYWDIDFVTGELTRGYTLHEPINQGNKPNPPQQVDQHWFDTSNKVMKVWSGSTWVEYIRVFAAKYQSGAIIVDYPLGSQVGFNNTKSYAGTPLFDPEGNPLQKFQRNRKGQFITTETDMHSQFARISNFRVEAAVVQGEASEHIPLNYAVAYSDFDTLKLASNQDLQKGAIGVAAEEMYTGEIRSFITKGFITNEVDWDWQGYAAETPLFLGPSGQITPIPDGTAPTQQQIGYIVNRTTIFVNIQKQALLEPPAIGNEIVYYLNRDTGALVARKIKLNLDDLIDVEVTNPQDGDVIVWDSTAGEWVLESNCCGGGGAGSLNELTDVDTGGSPLPNGYSLTYNSTTGLWEPAPKVNNLNDLLDVDIGTPADGDNLIFRTGSPSGWIAEPATTTDEFVKASGTDLVTGHLNTKLVAGPGVSFNILNPGANERIEITSNITATGVGLFVTDVTLPGSGIVSNYVYAVGTVPANAVVLEATSDQETVRVEFVVEGDGSFYSPTVTVDVPTGSPPVGDNVQGILTQDPQDIRTFHGYADIDIADGLLLGRTVYLVASTGAMAQVLIKRAPVAPQIQSMAFDGIYPAVAADPTSGYSGGTQSAIKSGDIFYVSGTVENTATLVTLNTGDAVGAGTFTTATAGGSLGANDSGGVGYKTFTIRFTASSASGVQTASAFAQNSFGTEGLSFVTANTVVMDQASPGVSIGLVSYPAGQSALKGSESATVSNSVSDQDYVYYYENGGAGFIDISNPNTFEASKNVDRIGGSYVYNGNNFAIVAFKTSNGTSTTVATGDVNISNVAPSVGISGATARLVSSPAGQNYSITLTFTQRLLQAPTIVSSGDNTAGDRGAWSGSGTTWSFNINVDDADIKGVYNWTVNNVNTLSNNTYNGVAITSGGTYEIGGFTYRYVTVGALEPVVDLGVDITDPTKVVVKYRDTADNLTYRGSDLSQFQKGWSAVAGPPTLVFTPGPEPFPNYSNFVYQDPTVTPTSWFFLTDAIFAGANTTGTLQIEIQEVA